MRTSSSVIAGIAVAAAAGLGIMVTWLYTNTSYAIGNIENLVIELRSSGCLGDCHAHSIVVLGDGTAIHQEHHNGETIEYVSSIPEDELRQLVNKFYGIGFFSLKDEYGCNAFDIQTTSISFRVSEYAGDRSKSVCIGLGPIPDGLQDLQDQINNMPAEFPPYCSGQDCPPETVEKANAVFEKNEDIDLDLSDSPTDSRPFETYSDQDATGIFKETDNDTRIEVEYNE